jgi:hypothetical protein
MHIPPWVHAALDGFTLGGLLSTGPPNPVTRLFPEEGHEEEAMAHFIAAAQRHNSPLAQELIKQLK